MTFTCRQCGKCCMFLGDYIAIEEQLGPFEFLCESVSTGTPFRATIDQDKRDLFQNREFPDKNPSACRFLRPDGSLIRCTIHRDSPAQCKYYRCETLRISDKTGKYLGYITGTLALHSTDPDLRKVWEEFEGMRPADDSVAENMIAGFLEGKGYRTT